MGLSLQLSGEEKIMEELWQQVIKPVAKELQPELISTGKNVAKEIGTKYEKQLKAKGREIAEDIVWKALKPFPQYIRSYISPKYVEKPSKVPAWVFEMVNPIVNPVITGAKEVAAEKAEKIKLPLYSSVAMAGIIIFAIGYAVGKKI